VIGGAIDGVTLNLAKAEQGTLVSLKVERDDAAALTRTQGFVTAYNALAQQVKALGAYDAATRTAGPMLGDSMLRGIETQLRKVATEPVAGATAPYTTLASLGIALTTNGTLELDSTKYNAAITADPDAVGRVVASANGVAVKLDAFLTQKLSSTGEFAARNTGVTSRRKDLDKQRDALDARMEVIQARYMKQFTALDSMLSQLQSTSSYLSQQLSSLSNLNRG
jgi:flagellar hook-associated protein 2